MDKGGERATAAAVTQGLASLTHTHANTRKHTQISTALSTFGLSSSTRHVLVARFDPGPGDAAAAAAAVSGTPAPVADLASLADTAAQAKAYGVGAGEYGSLADAVATRIAVRECG